MDEPTCSFEGCKNKRRHLKTGLCAPHRRVQLQEGALRPLRPRARLQSPTCTGPECSRPSEAHDLCKQHGEQLRKHGALHVIGDPEYRSRRQRERWQRMAPEDKARHMFWMASHLPEERSEETIRKVSATQRAMWAAKGSRPKACLTCGAVYEAPYGAGGWNKRYCSPSCRNLYATLRRHGLTYQRHQELLVEQDHRCALCRREWSGWGGRYGPHIDHDHDTGRVRGLLCGDCNTALGRFGDNADLLRRAITYLEREV